MANRKISEHTALSTWADADLIEVVDVSDTTDAASGTNKKTTYAEIKAMLDALYAELTGAAFTGSVYVGDTANAFMTLGVTINQGAADNEIVALKSSDVDHGMTGLAETDTYFSWLKSEATSGGNLMIGYKDADGTAGKAFWLFGRLGEAADTTKSTAGIGVVQISAQVKSGTSAGNVGADGNILAIANGVTTRFIFDAEGTLHHVTGDNDLDIFSLPSTTGAPTFGWDESENQFTSNVGVSITAGTLKIAEQAAADADRAGFGQLWVKTATPNELWFTDDAGTDHQIAFA